MRKIIAVILVLEAAVAWTQDRSETWLAAQEGIVGTWLLTENIAYIRPEEDMFGIVDSLVYFHPVHANLTPTDPIFAQEFTFNADGTGSSRGPLEWDSNEPLIWDFAYVLQIGIVSKKSRLC